MREKEEASQQELFGLNQQLCEQNKRAGDLWLSCEETQKARDAYRRAAAAAEQAACYIETAIMFRKIKATGEETDESTETD